VSIPVVLGSMRGLAAPAALKRDHPERFQKVVDAYQKVLARKDVQKYLERSGVGGDWLGPEKTTASVMSMYDVFKKYKDLLKP
jgi:tripartite-type tricarboxylate transporter receptor subunit TctC